MNKAQGTTCCPICTKPTPHGHDIKRWIGVDFDATLAYDIPNRTDLYELGKPIPEMVNRVRDWIGKGFTVKILTARMNKYSHLGFERDVEKMRDLLKAWSREHIGIALECTNIKDGFMEVLWDDRAVQVSRDTAYPIAYELDAVKQQLNAANKRIEELEANLNQVRSTYNQIIAEDTATRNEYLDEIAKLKERIRVADAEIKRLQGWVDVLEKPKVWSQAEIEAIKGSGLEYSMYLAEESLLVHRVVEEVQALRRGVGVSYAINDDPVEKLAKKLPPVENVVSTLAMIKAAMQKQLLKEK